MHPVSPDFTLKQQVLSRNGEDRPLLMGQRELWQMLREWGRCSGAAGCSTAPSRENSRANSLISEKQKESWEKITVLLYLRQLRFLSLSLDALTQATLEDKPFISANLAAFLTVVLIFVVVNIKRAFLLK